MATPISEEKIVVPPVAETTKPTIEGLMARLEEQAKDIQMLREVADKARLMTWEKRNIPVGARVIRISTYDKKYIKAWKMLDNDIFQDAKNLWHENQNVEIVLSDDTKVKLTYLDFTKVVKVECELVSRYTTPEGHHMMRVNFNGTEIDIDETFVN